MFEKICSLENLFEAWKRFSRGKMNSRDVCQFALQLENNIFTIHEQLMGSTYKHDPYEHFYVHDPKRRYISKASVKDRIVHQALTQVIEPLFEKSFIYDSYSSRKEKGIHAAVNRSEQFVRQGSRNYRHCLFALKCDIRKFFDSIDHDIVLSVLVKKIEDHRLLHLVSIVLNSYSTNNERTKGLPLGNVTSQLFANIYLNGFDHFVKEELRAQWYVRFCDDFVLFHSDRRVLEQWLSGIQTWLVTHRALELHPFKVTIRPLSQGIDVVGQVLLPRHRVLRTTTRRRIFHRMAQRAYDYWQGKISAATFRQSLQSCLGVLSHGSNYTTEILLRERIWGILKDPER